MCRYSTVQENDEALHDENLIELARFLITLPLGHRMLAQLQASSEMVANTIERVFRFLEYNSCLSKP
jgi:hypothetical protein